MIRTQIYLPQDMHRKLNRLAEEENKPMAEVVRDFIEDGLQTIQKKDTSGKKALADIARLGFSGGDRDLSSKIDHYLYSASKSDE